MTYTIWPHDMNRVFADTGTARDSLREGLDRMTTLTGDARAAAAASVPIAGELDRYLGEHDAATRETLVRVESALYNGSWAVAAYVRGDADMAGDYGRAAAVFDAPRLAPLAPLIGGDRLPVPTKITGG